MTPQAPELLPDEVIERAAKRIHALGSNFDWESCNKHYFRRVARDLIVEAIGGEYALTRPTPAERPVPIGAKLFRESVQAERPVPLEQRADAVDMPATIEELEQMICIEFPSSVATRHAAERVYNFLYARISIRAKTLARRPTESGLPLSEGQAEECDGGSRPVPQVREALIEYVSALRQHQIDPETRDELLNFIMLQVSARPSDAAVAWMTPDGRITRKAEYVDVWRGDGATIIPLYAIPHEEAVRALLKREAEKYAGYSDKPAFSGKHVANILQTALALSPTVASERVSERETMTSVPADRVIGELAAEQVIEREPLTVTILKDVFDAIEHFHGKGGLDAVAQFARMKQRSRESNELIDRLEAEFGLREA